jgi:hypothetical protein
VTHNPCANFDQPSLQAGQRPIGYLHNKVKALVEAGVTRIQIMEQVGISKASYYRCLLAS